MANRSEVVRKIMRLKVKLTGSTEPATVDASGFYLFIYFSCPSDVGELIDAHRKH